MDEGQVQHQATKLTRVSNQVNIYIGDYIGKNNIILNYIY